MKLPGLLVLGVMWLAACGHACGEEKAAVPPFFPPGEPGAGAAAEAPPDEWLNPFKKGWKDFSSFFIVTFPVSLLIATLLAGLLAYHPRSYGKAATLEEAEQPKTFLVYTIIGVICGQLVLANPAMAFAIFALGGLFRFRTEVGPAKDTGRAILATVIGVCCGINLYVVAIVGTAYAWVLIYLLEGRVAHRVVVKGIEAALLGKAAEAYEEVLRENGLTVMSEKKNFLKGQVAFVFRAPGELNREQLEGFFKDIPPKLQGSPDWESS